VFRLRQRVASVGVGDRLRSACERIGANANCGTGVCV
jgi:hypothetical protein